MFTGANSGAMDAAAHGRGPSTMVLPWLAGTDTGRILGYVADLAAQVTRIATLIDQVGTARTALGQAWPTGTASAGAATKLLATITAFEQITRIFASLRAETAGAAAAIDLAQQAYRGVVSATNPTVAALLSSPHTRPAATALSVSATSGLAGYVGGTKAVIDTIGLVRIAAVAASLLQVAQELRQLLNEEPTGGPASLNGAIVPPAVGANGSPSASPAAVPSAGGRYLATSAGTAESAAVYPAAASSPVAAPVAGSYPAAGLAAASYPAAAAWPTEPPISLASPPPGGCPAPAAARREAL